MSPSNLTMIKPCTWFCFPSCILFVHYRVFNVQWCFTHTMMCLPFGILGRWSSGWSAWFESWRIPGSSAILVLRVGFNDRRRQSCFVWEHSMKNPLQQGVRTSTLLFLLDVLSWNMSLQLVPHYRQQSLCQGSLAACLLNTLCLCPYLQRPYLQRKIPPRWPIELFNPRHQRQLSCRGWLLSPSEPQWLTHSLVNASCFQLGSSQLRCCLLETARLLNTLCLCLLNTLCLCPYLQRKIRSMTSCMMKSICARSVRCVVAVEQPVLRGLGLVIRQPQSGQRVVLPTGLIAVARLPAWDRPPAQYAVPVPVFAAQDPVNDILHDEKHLCSVCALCGCCWAACAAGLGAGHQAATVWSTRRASNWAHRSCEVACLRPPACSIRCACACSIHPAWWRASVLGLCVVWLLLSSLCCGAWGWSSGSHSLVNALRFQLSSSQLRCCLLETARLLNTLCPFLQCTRDLSRMSLTGFGMMRSSCVRCVRFVVAVEQPVWRGLGGTPSVW